MIDEKIVNVCGKLYHLSAICSAIDSFLGDYAKQGGCVPAENGKSHYLKALFMLSRLQKQSQLYPTNDVVKENILLVKDFISALKPTEAKQ